MVHIKVTNNVQSQKVKVMPGAINNGRKRGINYTGANQVRLKNCTFHPLSTDLRQKINKTKLACIKQKTRNYIKQTTQSENIGWISLMC